MLKDRGYIINEKKLAQTKQEFIENYNEMKESPNLLVSKRKLPEGEDPIPEGHEKLIVFFPDCEKFNMQHLKEIALEMLRINVLNAIIVIKGSTQISKKVRTFSDIFDSHSSAFNSLSS
jgi:hypothetical protein